MENLDLFSTPATFQPVTERTICRNRLSEPPPEPPDYDQRVRAYEAEGMTRSDAQSIVDLEIIRATPTPNTITANTYRSAGIYPRTLRGEADYVCGHCLAIVPDGVTCRHCQRKRDQQRTRLQTFLAAKQQEDTTP
jgi:hypothetical protein